MSDGFLVRTGVFEGPLDLLLALVEKRKLYINDISLAQVANDYVRHVRGLEAIPVGSTTHFVLVASTLILIKSRSLVPALALTEEEETSIEELQDRLRKYRLVVAISKRIAPMCGETPIWPRVHVANRLKPIFTPGEEITAMNLRAAAARVIDNLPKQEVKDEARVEKVVSIEEMIDRLSDRVSQRLRMSFSDFCSESAEERVSVVVGFLAMLELYKQGTVKLQQGSLFEEIHIESNLETM